MSHSYREASYPSKEPVDKSQKAHVFNLQDSSNTIAVIEAWFWGRPGKNELIALDTHSGTLEIPQGRERK